MIHAEITDRIIGCLICIHRALGPGLRERSYQAAAALEFAANGVRFVREPRFDVHYRDVLVGHHVPDFIVEDKVIVEVKCVAYLDPVFTAQALTYLRVTKLKVALLVNFNVAVLSDGVRRIVL